MEKVLLINGSPNEFGCTRTALDEIASELAREKIESEIFWLGKTAINDCIACYSCKRSGQCAFDDCVNEIAARLDEMAALVVGSPVYYGGPNGRLTSFLDRLFFSASEKLSGKFAASVVSCRRGGATAAFERLNQYFLMTNMNVVASQYWNQVHGSSSDDVKKDEEGLQTMRTLAKNMAHLIKISKLAEANGIEKPKYEPKIFTNFIRG